MSKRIISYTVAGEPTVWWVFGRNRNFLSASDRRDEAGEYSYLASLLVAWRIKRRHYGLTPRVFKA